MHRFFVGTSLPVGDDIVIDGTDARHISKVLRLGVGDEIIVCDKDGIDCECIISSVSDTEVMAKIQAKSHSLTEPEICVTLYQGVPKGDKLDTVTQKSVELGVSAIVPVAMKRSVAIIKDPKKRAERMQKIAREAAKQCQRARVPEAREVMTFADAVSDAKGADLCILPYEEEKSVSIKDVLKAAKNIRTVSIFIGPEGGFEPSEVELAIKNGFKTVSMGSRILRTETASLAAITAVMYELGDW